MLSARKRWPAPGQWPLGDVHRASRPRWLRVAVAENRRNAAWLDPLPRSSLRSPLAAEATVAIARPHIAAFSSLLSDDVTPVTGSTAEAS